jgi:hypothetical protein
LFCFNFSAFLEHFAHYFFILKASAAKISKNAEGRVLVKQERVPSI